MRKSPSNPSTNTLPSSVTDEQIVRAIKDSGYPLQGIVANHLLKAFHVTEEWGYVDRDSKEARSLDVRAYRRLHGGDEIERSAISLLIECKRSHEPYVFFRSVTSPLIRGFPSIAGLRSSRISIQEKGGKRSVDATPEEVLGLRDLSFITPGPPLCASFARAHLSGKKANLSGSDPFNALVLPLVKALDHTVDLYRPPERPERLVPLLALCVSVLDAPMILVESPDQETDPLLTPWVRVFRMEAVQDPRRWERFRWYVVDIVHIAAFAKVLEKHILPFAEEFAARASKLHEVLLKGGEVPDLEEWTWTDVGVRLS